MSRRPHPSPIAAALTYANRLLREDCAALLDSHCLKNEAGRPIVSTIDDEARPLYRRYREAFKRIDDALVVDRRLRADAHERRARAAEYSQRRPKP